MVRLRRENRVITTVAHAESLDPDGLAVRVLRPRIRVELVVIRRSIASPAAVEFCEPMNAVTGDG